MTEAGDKPAPTAEVEVLEDTDQPIEDSPPCPETPKETQNPKSEESNKAESAPTKTGKMVVCRVTMLDAEAYDIEVDKGAEGRVLFDKVCKTIKLREIEYFGLTYIGARDVKFWLNLDKRINKQLKGDRWVFEFAVKFYPPEPSFLLHDYTKYLLCLQIRIDVFNGRLPCSIVTHAILGAYTVQADIGDYEPPTEGKSEIDYLRDFDFAPHPPEELYHRIHDLHKTFKGMEDIDAEELYLENAKKLAMYGVDLHKAKDSQNVNIFLGVCASGVMVYRDKLRINRFVWPKILKLSYKRSNFYVKLRPTEGDAQENTICFKLENHKMAKLVWKTCVEHHAFFRLKEAEPPKKGTLFPRFNSRFRYSGRTQKQIQDGANTLDKQKEPFERRHPKRTDGNYIDRNSDHPLDEKDRLDRMNRDPATISSVGPPPYSKDDDRLNQTAPGESRADKPSHLPGEAEDRLDKERDETATLERRPEEQGTADIDVGPGITPVGRKSKRSKEEKEREKREKEEEKKRKKEEERKRKQQEKENKKKKDLDKSTTEDRTDKMGPDDSTLMVGDPGAAELQHDNETDKDKETDGEKEPSSPTTKDEKDKSKKDKKKDKKGDKHKEEKDKKGDKHDKDKKGDKHDKDKDDKKGSRKGLFGSGRKPKRSDSKSKQSDSEPSSPVSPGFDATAYPTTPPGGNLENQDTQSQTEVTVTEGESGQDQERVNDLDNSKTNSRKKEVKFIDECKISNDPPVTIPENTNSEQVTEETVPTVAAVVNTMPENHKIPEEQIKENGKQSEKIEATPIIQGVADVKEVTKVDKSSEQVIPDENIDDEVFEPEAENMEKVQENNVNTATELEEKTVVTEGQGDSDVVIGTDSTPQTEVDIQLQVEGKTSEEELVNGLTEKEAVEPEDVNKGNVEIELVNENKTDDKVDSVEVVENTDDKVHNNEVKEEAKEKDDEQQKEDVTGVPVSSDVTVDENNTKDQVEVKIDEVEHQEEVKQVVINPDDVKEESVNKGELILPIKVTTEEAGNNHESKDAEITGAEGGKEENQCSEKEKKPNEKEEKKKEKEEKKKEKERLKKEEKERKRLEKEQKKKEMEEKKKLDKEKKEKEKQKKKSKKSSSSVSPAVEEVKDDQGQGQGETEEAPPSPTVDPVQVELAVALQQRKKQGEEEEISDTKQEGTGEQPVSEPATEPVESPENEPEPSKTQEKVNQSESNDHKTKEDVPDQNSDKPTESPEENKSSEPNEQGIKETAGGCQEKEAKTVKPKKSKKEKKEKKEKEKKEKKEKKKKNDSTGCFAFMKKPQKSESDEDTVPVEDMPVEPWNTEIQEHQEPKEEEVMEEKVAPKQRGVGLGWALPAFEEMKERQAAAAAAREAKPAGSEIEKPRSCSITSLKSSSSSSSSSSEEGVHRVPQAPLADLSEGLSVEAGLDGEGVRYGDWPVDREGSIDRKMQFIAVTPPSTETKEVNGIPENEGMAFFEPPGGADVNGETVKVKKVPPPVPPKGVRGSSDLDNMSEEDRLRYMGADGLPPTVATESMKYAPDTDETPIATTNFPTVKTETRTVTYEKDGIPVAIEDGILISSQSHSTRTQTIETTTYKTERDGMMETRMEKKVIISEDNNDIDHDQLLADAIRAVTEMDQNMSVEKIECTRQIES